MKRFKYLKEVMALSNPTTKIERIKRAVYDFLMMTVHGNTITEEVDAVILQLPKLTRQEAVSIGVQLLYLKLNGYDVRIASKEESAELLNQDTKIPEDTPIQ